MYVIMWNEFNVYVIIQAKLNVLRGKYPIEINIIVQLAGIQMAIEEPYNEETCIQSYYK